jgi:guanylate kinase
MVKAMQSKAMIVILSAPSGGGKTSISKSILADQNIVLSISATTRNPRPGEQEATHYFFKTVEEFQKMHALDEFLESAEIYGNLYGTPQIYVDKMLASGRDVLFDIDHQGAEQIRQKLSDQVVSIFILPPSIESLKERLEQRGQDSEDTINKRLKLAKKEMSHAENYDYIVVNDDFEKAVENIRVIIEQERKKRSVHEG